MPKYKAHLVGGIATFLLILAINTKLQKINLTANQALLCLSFCLLGSVFPDIDTKSKIQKILYFPLFFAMLGAIFFKKWTALLVLCFMAFIPILANHRGLTHRLWFLILVPLSIPALISNFDQSYFMPALVAYLFFVAGAFSHILLDFGPIRFLRVLFGKKG